MSPYILATTPQGIRTFLLCAHNSTSSREDHHLTRTPRCPQDSANGTLTCSMPKTNRQAREQPSAQLTQNTQPIATQPLDNYLLQPPLPTRAEILVVLCFLRSPTCDFCVGSPGMGCTRECCSRAIDSRPLFLDTQHRTRQGLAARLGQDS